MKYLFLLGLSSLINYKTIYGQNQQGQIACVGFYNLENLFDPYRDSTILDEEFTPSGAKSWTEEKYLEKLNNLSTVIADLGKPLAKEGAVILGVAEVENRRVLRDLINTPKLADAGYQIVHYDSKDSRGIDVALLYKSKYFKVLETKSIPVLLQDTSDGRKYTRNVLLVKGDLAGQTLYISVNHWPSRRGGAAFSMPFRIQLARLNYQLFDSIRTIDPHPAFIVMGDLNDNPDDPSIHSFLKAEKKIDDTSPEELFNPFWQVYKNGYGSLAHEDSWSLFDQIILSHRLIMGSEHEFNYKSCQIYHKQFMMETEGHFKNYPKRSFSGDVWNHGFSDHFPALVYLLRKK
ncbi:MAG: endonuclease/exonuclease/phosphatase family protein [Saprospiraceae bacterium]